MIDHNQRNSAATQPDVVVNYDSPISGRPNADARVRVLSRRDQ